MGEKEPNYYLPKVYKRVNNIIYAVIAVPTVRFNYNWFLNYFHIINLLIIISYIIKLIALTITIILHANNPDKCPYVIKNK